MTEQNEFLRKMAYAFSLAMRNATNSVCKKISLVHNGDIHVLPSGVKMFCPMYPWDYIQNIVVGTSKFYEQEILEDLAKYIPDDAVILDIGANIGNHSLYWAKICGAKKIHAFEPIKTTFEMLEKNISLNGLEKVIIPHNIALGERAGFGDIAVYLSHNIGFTNIKESPYGFPIAALDDIDLGRGKIDFVKIDVEGFELKTLAGMKGTLKKHKPAVFIEAGSKTAAAVAEFFKNIGYRKPIAYKDGNWLFLPDGEGN